MKTVRLGTRRSLLARTQTNWVAQRLKEAYPNLAVEICLIETTGDRDQERPFAQIGTKGMFVKEIEQALLRGEIDAGVHSAKDMPSELPDGLTIICYPAREAVEDVLVCRERYTFQTLPPGSVVGTSSARRRAQLLFARDDLRVEELRGNLDTRLRKLQEGLYHAIVLAAAGLNRLGVSGGLLMQPLPLDICLPAPGQGALAIEACVHNTEIATLFASLHCERTASGVRAERAFQAALGGGCAVPMGACALWQGEKICLHGVVASPDGKGILRETMDGDPTFPEELGRALAGAMLSKGAGKFLES